jgi:hypothetical protein
MNVTVGMLKRYLENLDENLEVVVYNDDVEADTFLYGAPVVCTADKFRYCAGDSCVSMEDNVDPDKLYCYFNM